MLRKLDKKGDTIVEVLIAIAIVSLTLTAAYSITIKNVNAIQDNQERIQAQHLVETQIEAIRSNNGLTDDTQCFPYDSTTETDTCTDLTVPGSGASYTVSIQIDGDPGLNPVNPTTYTVTATWTSIGSDTSNDSTVSMAYRLN